MNDRIEEFKSRYTQWKDVSIRQLSITNNVLITLSSGLFIFCLEQEKILKFHIILSDEIDLEATFFWFAILLLSWSLFVGLAVLLCRLYDFRISRHISLTRLRFYKAHINENIRELPYEQLEEPKFLMRLTAFVKIIFCRLPFIASNQVQDILQNPTLIKDFQKLRETSYSLGINTWRWTKLQILLFLISGVCYSIRRLIMS